MPRDRYNHYGVLMTYDSQIDADPDVLPSYVTALDNSETRLALLQHPGPANRPYPHQYVLVHARENNRLARALLVKKPENSMHAGLFNLPGGKVNPSEFPAETAVREFQEETGFLASFPVYCGELTDLKTFVVYCFTVNAAAPHYSVPRAPAEHETRYFHFDDIPGRAKMVQNVPLLMTLLGAGVRQWTILEDASEPGSEGWRGMGGSPFSGVYFNPPEQVERLECDKAWRKTVYGSMSKPAK